ncbi:hypothetical protein BDW69DRAFT_180523 [Aspergillus filifer]
MKMMMVSDPYHFSNRVPVGKGDSLITGRRLQAPSLEGPEPRQDCLPEDSAIRRRRSRGLSVLAWGKDHLSLKGLLSRERCRLPLNPDGIVDPWEGVSISRPWPRLFTSEQAAEQPSSRIHLSRRNDRLNPCDCPAQGPLCGVPPVSATSMDDDADAAAQRTMGNKIMEWANGREKQAMVIHDRYVLSVNSFRSIPGSNPSLSDLYVKRGSGIDRKCSTSSLNETVMAIQYASSITTKGELVLGAVNRSIPRKPVASQQSETGSISTSPTLSASGREKNDRVERLERRSRSLARRRECIEKAIHNLMWYSQPCSALEDGKAREERKRTTARLHSDLADVRREQHEIGLRLFRALRSQDERDYCGGASTSLWVSRVTR